MRYRYRGRHRGKYVVPPGITRAEYLGPYEWREIYIGDHVWWGKFYGVVPEPVGTFTHPERDIIKSRVEYNTFDNWNNDEWWAQR